MVSVHNSGQYKIGGPGNVNTQMAMMYLNAAQVESVGEVIWPVYGAKPRPFSDSSGAVLFVTKTGETLSVGLFKLELV
jgi:hypothetical protein